MTNNLKVFIELRDAFTNHCTKCDECGMDTCGGDFTTCDIPEGMEKIAACNLAYTMLSDAEHHELTVYDNNTFLLEMDEREPEWAKEEMRKCREKERQRAIDEVPTLFFEKLGIII